MRCVLLQEAFMQWVMLSPRNLSLVVIRGLSAALRQKSQPASQETSAHKAAASASAFTPKSISASDPQKVIGVEAVQGMRPLTDEETKVLFEKLANYIGKNIEQLINRPDEKHCFRLHKDRVYYVSERLMRQATSVSRDTLLSLGTCFGKFTKTGKFRLHITALDYIAQYAKYKVWIKPSAEMSFLYGNHVQKSGLGRITENTPKYGGTVVYSMSDVPLGFGVAAQPTEYCKDLDPTAVVVLHQADVGEYLRVEDNLL